MPRLEYYGQAFLMTYHRVVGFQQPDIVRGPAEMGTDQRIDAVRVKVNLDGYPEIMQQPGNEVLGRQVAACNCRERFGRNSRDETVVHDCLYSDGRGGLPHASGHGAIEARGRRNTANRVAAK